MISRRRGVQTLNQEITVGGSVPYLQSNSSRLMLMSENSLLCFFITCSCVLNSMSHTVSVTFCHPMKALWRCGPTVHVCTRYQMVNHKVPSLGQFWIISFGTGASLHKWPNGLIIKWKGLQDLLISLLLCMINPDKKFQHLLSWRTWEGNSSCNSSFACIQVC